MLSKYAELKIELVKIDDQIDALTVQRLTIIKKMREINLQTEAQRMGSNN